MGEAPCGVGQSVGRMYCYRSVAGSQTKKVGEAQSRHPRNVAPDSGQPLRLKCSFPPHQKPRLEFDDMPTAPTGSIILAATFALVTALFWGTYGPILHKGSHYMGSYAEKTPENP